MGLVARATGADTESSLVIGGVVTASVIGVLGYVSIRATERGRRRIESRFGRAMRSSEHYLVDRSGVRARQRLLQRG